MTKKATQEASKAFEHQKTSKLYLALLRGFCQENEYEIDEPIGDDSRPEINKIRVATSQSEFCIKPRSAKTLIQVLNKGLFQGDPVTKVVLKPLTGRRHQLRVHSHSIGHRIVGDFTYSNGQDDKTERMYLHAYRLSLPTNLEGTVLNIDLRRTLSIKAESIKKFAAN